MLREEAMPIISLIKVNPNISKHFHDIQNIRLVHSFSLKTGKKLVSPFNNVDPGTRNSNDLPKVTPGKQGLEPIYSIFINLLPEEA